MSDSEMLKIYKISRKCLKPKLELMDIFFRFSEIMKREKKRYGRLWLSANGIHAVIMNNLYLKLIDFSLAVLFGRFFSGGE